MEKEVKNAVEAGDVRDKSENAQKNSQSSPVETWKVEFFLEPNCDKKK